MSLKRNIVANYASQIYVTLIGIAMVPVYLRYMGVEAYALIGFFAMLQVWFQLLDIGLTPTMARETARFRGGVTDVLSYRRLVRSLEGIFFTVALVGGVAMYAAAGYISRDWLQAKQLPIAEIQTSVQFMAVIIALRWISTLYRSTISGAERQVWLGVSDSFIATLRFVGVLLVFIFISATPTVFFSYQLCVAVLELAWLLFHAYRLLPSVSKGNPLPWSWTPIKQVLKFSLSMCVLSLLWVLVTQTDKLLLSKLLPLAEYGYFTLAVLVASGILTVSAPVSGAILPRLVKLEAEGDHAGLIRVYRHATQLVTVVAGAATITIVFSAESLLWAWTGDKALAHQAAQILIPYAIGNGILAVSAFPYYLQFAKGDLRLHLFGNAGLVVLLVPSIYFAAAQYGGVGAGYVWLVMNFAYFVLWVPLVHRRLEPGLNKLWFGRDVLVICAASVAVGYGLFEAMPTTDSRSWQFVGAVIMGLLVMLAGALASSVIWDRVKASCRNTNGFGIY